MTLSIKAAELREFIDGIRSDAYFDRYDEKTGDVHALWFAFDRFFPINCGPTSGPAEWEQDETVREILELLCAPKHREGLRDWYRSHATDGPEFFNRLRRYESDLVGEELG